MKKLSLMLGALALVLGMSQCKKDENKPLHSGEKQHIELTASNGNDGTKIAVTFASDMNLTWEEGDVITVSGGAEGTLELVEGASTAKGSFSGDITLGDDYSSSDLVFTYKQCESTPDFNTQDGSSDWIEANLVLEAKHKYEEDGEYSLTMKMPYAVLKLDLSYFAETPVKDGATVEIKREEENKSGKGVIASVTGVTSASIEMFVALPLPETSGKKTYEFVCGDNTVKRAWELAANAYYTAEDNAAVVIVPYTFTVNNSGKTVTFAPGNLYYDGSKSKWYFEANQWDYRTYEGKTAHISRDGSTITKTPTGNWGLFGWSTSKNTYGMSTSTNAGTYSGNFKDWGDVSNLPASGTGNGWRTLSGGDNGEWNYLLNTRKVNNKTGYKNTCIWATVNGVNGLIIFHDRYTGATSGLESIPDGCVFLPAAGYRSGNSVLTTNFYWSKTPYNDSYSYRLKFEDGTVSPAGNAYRYYGFSVRLVSNN